MALGSTLGLSEAIATEPLCLDTSDYMTEREKERESKEKAYMCALCAFPCSKFECDPHVSKSSL